MVTPESLVLVRKRDLYRIKVSLKYLQFGFENRITGRGSSNTGLQKVQNSGITVASPDNHKTHYTHVKSPASVSTSDFALADTSVR